MIEDSAELRELGCVYSVVDDILIVQSTYNSILEPGTATALPNRTAVGIVINTFLVFEYILTLLIFLFNRSEILLVQSKIHFIRSKSRILN